MESNVISRQELYDLVWSEPLTTIVKRLNVSYPQLRKVLTDMQVPIPENGHWQKLQYGKTVRVIELPSEYEGSPEVELSSFRKEVSESNVLLIKDNSAVEEIHKDKKLKLKVPKKLSKPDKLIEAARISLANDKGYHYPYVGLAHTNRGELNIRVSHPNIPRALRFMDAFIKLLRQRGHDVIIQYDDTYAVIDGENFKIHLREKQRMIKPKDGYGSTEWHPAGLFIFAFDDYHGKEWVDGKVLIEEKMADILAKLEAEAKREKEDRIKAEEYHKVWEEKERIKKEHKERIEREAAKLQKLYKKAERWQRARFMRDYIKAVKENAVERNELSEDLQNWINWANDKVDWYDPLVKKEDSLLDNIDKNKLF